MQAMLRFARCPARFDVCDGSRVAAAFLAQHCSPPLPAAGDSAAAPAGPDACATAHHAEKASMPPNNASTHVCNMHERWA